MNKFKFILKKIFFLPPLPTVLLSVFGYAFVLSVAAFDIKIPIIQYMSYISSAYALIITITGFPYFINFIKSVKQYINEHYLMKKIRKTAIGERFFNDIRFRTEISLYQGLFINLIYITIKIFSGIYYHSLWFISIAIYYILLAIMRFLLLHNGKRRSGKNKIITEFRCYKYCGIVLLIMNQALAVIVILMVHQNKGFNYPGILIYAMAMYAFYSVITAVVNIVKFRKHGSPIMSASKAINFVGAIVSILSLETAMLARFGGDDENFRIIMTGTTGGGVCTVVILMAIYMIIRATKNLKNLQINNS